MATELAYMAGGIRSPLGCLAAHRFHLIRSVKENEDEQGDYLVDAGIRRLT
jgi:hypothetical protein